MSIEKLSLPGSKSTPLFVSCFDESLNEVTYSKQIDIHVIFFGVAKLSVERFYIGSQFMGHATHEDTLRDFKKAHQVLDIFH